VIHHDQKDVLAQLNCNGMCQTYTRWVYHGEALSDDESHSGDHGLYESNGEEGFEDVDDINFDDDASTILDDLGKSGKKSGSIPNLDAKLLEEAKRELHEGCNTYTWLAFNIRLLYVKSYGRITNRALDLIMQLLCAALPWVNFPKSYADAKLSEVGLGYHTIHVCKFDCSLFWGDHVKDTHCHVCGFYRWKDPNAQKRLRTRCFGTFP
jgi:hypothetical protein